MGPNLEFRKLEEFPQYDSPIEFPEYQEPTDFASFQEPQNLPKYEETVDFPKYEELPEFSEIDESTSVMADISGTPRSPSSPTNKNVEQIVRTPGRKPSPQPTHFSVPPKNGNGNGHRILRSATVGYIAPEFKGKAAQMLQGETFSTTLKFCSNILKSKVF